MRYSRVSLGLLALLWPASVQGQAEGPFGVTMGSPISKYPSCKTHENAGFYTCDTLPKAHASFEMYSIQAHPKVGVCFVKGIGKDINRDARGVMTRAEVKKLAEQIEQTYGPHTAIRDSLSSRSALKDPADWLMAVEQDERTFSYDWTKGDYPNGIATIHVFARATSGQTGYAVVEFYFKNEKQCDNELDKEAF